MAFQKRSIGVFVIVTSFSILSSSLALGSAGTIEEIGGIEKVKVSRAGKTILLKKGDSLEIDDQIITDKLTAVDVRLEDQSIVRVGINSSYKIEKDSVSGSLLHRLFDGIVRVLVPKKVDGTKQKEIRFKMQTPEGTIGVRGTEFVVIHSADNTMLKGLSGDVLFGASGADLLDESKVEHIKSGFQSSVAAGASHPSKPVEFDADTYQRQLNSSGSPFGPLSSRVHGAVIPRTEIASNGAGTGGGGSALSAAAIAAPKQAESTKDSSTDGKRPAKVNPDILLTLSMDEVDSEKMAKAVKLGAAINKRDKAGDAPLHWAVANLKDKEKDQVFLQAMVLQGAKVNIKNKEGETPLMVLARTSGSVMIAKALLVNDAKIDEKNTSGKTARDIALEKDNEELAKYLGCKMKGEENCD